MKSLVITSVEHKGCGIANGMGMYWGGFFDKMLKGGLMGMLTLICLGTI